jgi:ubiquinone/menaquinone biosynthesis C-methylase UbiE
MVDLHKQYEVENAQQQSSEHDVFTVERYEQFFRFFPQSTVKVLDVGCNTGKGGMRLKELDSSLEIFGLDCVQDRLNVLPKSYINAVYGLSIEIPFADRYFDVIVAGEFLEHLYPTDVDKTLFEFQRVLKVGGKLLMTTPNPDYVRHKIRKSTVYSQSHLTQHFPHILKLRLMMHGFSGV